MCYFYQVNCKKKKEKTLPQNQSLRFSINFISFPASYLHRGKEPEAEGVWEGLVLPTGCVLPTQLFFGRMYSYLIPWNCRCRHAGLCLTGLSLGLLWALFSGLCLMTHPKEWPLSHALQAVAFSLFPLVGPTISMGDQGESLKASVWSGRHFIISASSRGALGKRARPLARKFWGLWLTEPRSSVAQGGGPGSCVCAIYEATTNFHKEIDGQK